MAESVSEVGELVGTSAESWGKAAAGAQRDHYGYCGGATVDE